jgi:hypothetical protein
MTQCRLPQELISAVIDSFQSPNEYRDLQALRTCSLVCRSWLPLCQRLLFHTIQFVTRSCCRRCRTAFPHTRRLDQALLDSPHLAGYIRELELSNAGCWNCHRRWMATDETLPSMLRKLGNVQKLLIHQLRWSTLSVDLRQSLGWVLQLPSITVLQIGSGHFGSDADFLNFISHARDLTSLSLYDIKTPSTGQAPLTPGDREEIGDGGMLTWNKWGRLSDLNLVSYFNPVTVLALVRWLLGPPSRADISHVERLSIVPHEEVVNPLLQTIGSSLEHLELHLPPLLGG